MESISERVKNCIAEQLGIDADEVTAEKTFDDLGADSLDMVEVVMSLEEEFDIEITDEDGEAVKTVQDAIDTVTRIVG